METGLDRFEEALAVGECRRALPHRLICGVNHCLIAKSACRNFEPFPYSGGFRSRPAGEFMMKTCYVSMAFGVKYHAESSRSINYDRIYRELIVPAAEKAGLVCQRADDFVGSLIHKDIAKAIITADVMLADVSNGKPT
jgi:hypothetical protein